MAECKYEGCTEQAWPKCPKGFCIYHSPNNSQDKAIARQVWKEARERAQDPQGCNFKGWHFPKDPEKWVAKRCFKGIIFQGNAFFMDATFQGEAYFLGATFHGQAVFNRATFHGKAYFVSTRIQGGTDIFIDRPSPELPFCEAKPFRKREEGQWLYRLAKECARRQGNYRLAGKYHFAEQCAIEFGKRKEHGWKFWLWIWEWLFARTIFGYGEKIHRPLIAGLAVIFIWMGLYRFFYAIGPSGLSPAQLADYQPNIWDSFYFSVVSFTTLGYGDMVPKLGFRGLASVEAVLGASLMAVFIVALTRKYMR